MNSYYFQKDKRDFLFLSIVSLDKCNRISGMSNNDKQKRITLLYTLCGGDSLITPDSRRRGVHRMNIGVNGRGQDFNNFQHHIFMDSVESVLEI